MRLTTKNNEHDALVKKTRGQKANFLIEQRGTLNVAVRSFACCRAPILAQEIRFNEE